MSKGSVMAGKAFVELSMKDKSKKGFNKAAMRMKKLKTLSLNVAKSVGKIGLAAGAVSTGLAAAFSVKAIKNASSMQEQLSKFDQVFADNSDASKAWADQFAEDVGRSKRETISGLNMFQSFFRGMGLGAREAAKLSEKMQGLSVDFASFNNLSDQEAIERFISALGGSSEVLDKFGIDLRSASLNAKLLELGFPKISDGATEFHKRMARLAIIEDVMGDTGALGDAVRTAGSFANQTKRVQANIDDLTGAIGEKLLPTATKLVKTINDEWPTIEQTINDAIASFEGIDKTVIPAVKFLTAVLGEFADMITSKLQPALVALEGLDAFKKLAIEGKPLEPGDVRPAHEYISGGARAVEGASNFLPSGFGALWGGIADIIDTAAKSSRDNGTSLDRSVKNTDATGRKLLEQGARQIKALEAIKDQVERGPGGLGH